MNTEYERAGFGIHSIDSHWWIWISEKAMALYGLCWIESVSCATRIFFCFITVL